MTPAIVWSIAGTDCGGGAGLAADVRSASAFDVHLCPVVAVVTAQNSVGVQSVSPVGPRVLDAQLRALATDMPPAVIKTGLLGSVAQVAVVAQWVDRLRQSGPVALVVDPVLGSSSGASFANEAVLQAYRDELLPRATLITPNRAEALRLLGETELQAEPLLARRLLAMGPTAVCITGGDSGADTGQACDWLHSPQAQGWLVLPRVASAHQHGTGCTFATSVACAVARGFVLADAVVLAKMATTHALRHGHPAGQGAGPVHARAGFASDPQRLPRMSWSEKPLPVQTRSNTPLRRLGLYAIVDSVVRLQQVLDAGVRTVQLRIKTPTHPSATWWAELNAQLARAVVLSQAAGAELFINDHWHIAQTLGASGVHLGQEDLLAMQDHEREALHASGMAVGISTHSLWELCRARSLSPRYVACGPVWPTLTKAMPWLPQGLHNLAWWQQMAGVPVVAIGGILDSKQVQAAAACGVDGVCVVRALGDAPAQAVPQLQKALDSARGRGHGLVPAFPRPSLAPHTGA